MFLEAKVTEIYCMADDFCKEFAKVQENTWLETREKTSQQAQPGERCGNHGHPDHPDPVSLRRFQVFQALL